MPIFGQYTGGDAFNVGGNMDAILQQQQATNKALLGLGEQIQNASTEMDVLRSTASAILAQYPTDEKGNPSNSAPKYVHDIYKSINKEGGLGYLSKSQLVATLEGYKTGAAVEEQALKTRQAQQQISINELNLNKAQMEMDELKKVQLAHQLALETAGGTEGTSSRTMEMLKKFSPVVASVVAPTATSLARSLSGYSSPTQPIASVPVPTATATATPATQQPQATTTQSKTLEHRQNPNITPEAQAERDRIEQQLLRSKKLSLEEELKKIDEALNPKPTEKSGLEIGLDIANDFTEIVFGSHGWNPYSDASNAFNAWKQSETEDEYRKRMEAQQAKVLDLSNRKIQIQGELAKINAKIVPEKEAPAKKAPSQETPAKPVGATPVGTYDKISKLEARRDALQKEVSARMTPEDWEFRLLAQREITEINKELTDLYKVKLSPEEELKKAQDTLKSALAEKKPMTYDEAIKSGKLKELVSAYQKERGENVSSRFWNSGYSLFGSTADHSRIMKAYKDETGIDIELLQQSNSLTDKDVKDYEDWANANSRPETLKKLQLFAQGNIDAWQWKIDTAKRQVELLTRFASEKAKEKQTAQQQATTTQTTQAKTAQAETSTPAPASIAPSGSKAYRINPTQEAQQALPPVVGQPELKSDDEKIAEEFGQLTSRLKSMGGVPMNWSESTFRQIRGYPPKVRIMTSNGIKLVGIGDKWEVVQEKAPTVQDQIAMEKHAILKSAIRADRISTEKWIFRGDIRTTEATEAGKVKQQLLDTTRAIDALDRLIDLGETGMWDSLLPTAKSGAITAVTNSVQAAGRTEIAGSGAFSEQDAKKLEDIVPSLASVSGAVFRVTALEKLKEYRLRMSEKVKGVSNAWGIQSEEASNSGLTKQQEAFLRVKYQEFLNAGVPAEQAKQMALDAVLNQ